MNDKIDSALSYTTGTGAFAMGVLMDVASYAQIVAMVLGAGVVAIKFLHDGAKYLDYLKSKKDD